MTPPLSSRLTKKLDALNSQAQAHGLEARVKREKNGLRYAIGSDERGIVFSSADLRSVEYYLEGL